MMIEVRTARESWEESYKPLPNLSLMLSLVWTLLACIWAINTWSKRRFQRSHLQWVITTVPVLKALVLGLTFVFWYSCLNFSNCSFWAAFGVFVARIFSELSCVISFLLIAHGYCIVHDQLSLTNCRRIGGLSFLVYLTLTGYKSGIQQFSVLVIVVYVVFLSVVMANISCNLVMLQEHLEQLQDEVGERWHMGVYAMLIMFKQFRRAVTLMVVAKLMMHAQGEALANEYPRQLFIREVVEISILLYMGWIVRSRELTPFSTIIPILNSPSRQHALPPIYSVEMDKKDFNNFDIKEWHIGVPTSISKCASQMPILVIVQSPGISSPNLTRDNDDLCKDSHSSSTSENNKLHVSASSSFTSLKPPLTAPRLSPTFQDATTSKSSTAVSEGLQQRVQVVREETSSGGGEGRTHSDACKQVKVKEHKYTKDHCEDMGMYTGEVMVDTKAWKRSFSFLSLNHDCNDLFTQSYCLSSI
ncbi:hypothetical protein BDL97_08G100000 [Sphagnum fallax]|nr:hypothetical protein BDL97_08G100000 [Sphagnum fallax]KAH8954801.1 hypothetical protein BDL97_08G100000 [Sphagnum fallax]KAH8954802.1 hypothetical protein BDL97_08G100000 [Sphagnum fallax]